MKEKSVLARVSGFVRKGAVALALGASVLVAPVSAFATGAGVVTTAATTAAATFTSDGTGAITAIGIALISLAGIAVLFKWGKAMFFG